MTFMTKQFGPIPPRYQRNYRNFLINHPPISTKNREAIFKHQINVISKHCEKLSFVQYSGVARNGGGSAFDWLEPAAIYQMFSSLGCPSSFALLYKKLIYSTCLDLSKLL